MKRFFLYVLIGTILISACSSSKPKLDKVQPNISKLQSNGNLSAVETTKKTYKKDKNEPQKDKPSANIIKKDDREKKALNERQKREKRKKKEEQNLQKENIKKQKKADSERKKKEKKRDELIKNAAKQEKKRIEEERRREKENLLNTINENQNNLKDQNNNSVVIDSTLIPVDTTKTDDSKNQSLEEILQSNNANNTSIVKDVYAEEDNTPSFLRKFKKKKTNTSSTSQTEKEKKKKMTTMDKVLYMIEKKNRTINTDDTLQQKVDSLYIYDKVKIKNFVKKICRKIFPKREKRYKTYDKLYSEAPKRILIAYPWNRSNYNKAGEMLYIMATKMLGKRGYYVYSAIEGMERHKKDTMFSSQYIQLKDLKNIQEQYDADAVMFITVFRFDNPYWSSATKSVAHYTLISTKTLDTLFVRKLEFNYDTPIPPKEYHNKELELDSEQVYDLGVIEQMQIFAFQDIPYGPYHKKYNKDKKKYSQKKEIKYKINVRPS